MVFNGGVESVFSGNTAYGVCVRVSHAAGDHPSFIFCQTLWTVAAVECDYKYVAIMKADARVKEDIRARCLEFGAIGN
jgi:hypothetical protein